jgi:septation ring formation regulator EzrA
MSKESPLSVLLGQLNREFSLSEEFKNRVTQLIERLEGLNLPAEQVQALLGKVRETYERQVLVESCREESRKSLDRIQGAIQSYSNALNNINERLGQAEAALENLLNSKPAPRPALSRPSEEKAILPFDREKEKAKALAAFASISSKNSRIN